MIQSPTLLSELADHNVQKVGVHEGDITEIGNLRLTWKVRGASTGFQFGILSVSSFQHELILTQGGRFVQKDDPVAPQPNPEDLKRFTEVARQNQAYWVELGS